MPQKRKQWSLEDTPATSNSKPSFYKWRDTYWFPEPFISSWTYYCSSLKKLCFLWHPVNNNYFDFYSWALTDTVFRASMVSHAPGPGASSDYKAAADRFLQGGPILKGFCPAYLRNSTLGNLGVVILFFIIHKQKYY